MNEKRGDATKFRTLVFQQVIGKPNEIRKTLGGKIMVKVKRGRTDRTHDYVVLAKGRVGQIIDEVTPEDLVLAIKRAPSLRGMILGYIAEEMFERHVLQGGEGFDDIRKQDDHDRAFNKADRDFIFDGRRYSVQLKSIQTNSIRYDLDLECLIADVQNDGSDMRQVRLQNGNVVTTTCYKRGDYDVLAVPLFPFTGDWTFAYKRNIDCRTCESKKYSPEDRQYLLATTERISFPLSLGWTDDLRALLRTIP